MEDPAEHEMVRHEAAGACDTKLKLGKGAATQVNYILVKLQGHTRVDD